MKFSFVLDYYNNMRGLAISTVLGYIILFNTHVLCLCYVNIIYYFSEIIFQTILYAVYRAYYTVR